MLVILGSLPFRKVLTIMWAASISCMSNQQKSKLNGCCFSCVWLCSCDMFLLGNWSVNPSCGWFTVWEPLKLINEDHFYLTAFRMSSHSLWCFALYFLFPADAYSSCSLEYIIWSIKILLMTKSWEDLACSFISLLEVKSDVCIITEFCDLGFII